ncbi:hypothetical protein TevJSym_bh00010 [endosymbiont of Tevnia jerichonana (vent Tica)]|uniref:Cytochrome c domain-containing protein n=1 Tax=endosymbiont of Tevnia jerichonana (vent Tica) TaxID=1049564 RepID=G2FIW1_9GAMM|nr:hypothetical protein TevJSym_bh00010 [endosymbiont of Tevnia jerichonana (vent Tica)]
MVGATVTIRDRNLEVIATTTSDQQASFNFTGEIADSAFPLIVEATYGIDLVTNAEPDFILSGVLMDATATRVNLTPHTTMIVKSAMAMEGGLTAENLAIATEAVTSKLNFGLDTSTVADPMTSAVTNDNITEVVLSSEVFGEMARRSAYWIGGNVTEDDIFAALAADLSDSALDGKGAPGTVPRYTAIAHIVSAQVLIEAMVDGLQVHNQPASNALDDAIAQVLGTADRSLHRSVREIRANRLMLAQARAALAAAQAIDPSIPLGDLLTVLAELQNAANTSNLSETISNAGGNSSLSNGLGQTISIVSNASSSSVSHVNQVASGTNNASNSGNGPHESSVARGSELYAQQCAACHGSDPANGSRNIARGTSANSITGTHNYVDNGDAQAIAAYISNATKAGNNTSSATTDAGGSSGSSGSSSGSTQPPPLQYKV